MQHYSTSLGNAAKSIFTHRRLILDLIRRDVLGRYRGSIGGLFWSLVHPLLMLAVYTFVFSVVFKARWGDRINTDSSDFAVIMFAGIIVHGLFAECVNKAPGLILSNVNYVKKVVFPLDVLPVVALGSAFFHFCVSAAILIVFHWWTSWTLDFGFLWLFVVLIPFTIFNLGITWFLAATGVFIRDISQTTGILTTVLLFMSPIFYPVSALPERYQIFLQLNPLTFIIEQVRQVTIWGNTPNFVGLALYTVFALIIAAISYWWFQRTRRGFADVL